MCCLGWARNFDGLLPEDESQNPCRLSNAYSIYTYQQQLVYIEFFHAVDTIGVIACLADFFCLRIVFHTVQHYFLVTTFYFRASIVHQSFQATLLADVEEFLVDELDVFDGCRLSLWSAARSKIMATVTKASGTS